MEDDKLEKCECGFETDDVFEMFNHCGMNMDWRLKITSSFSFNLFSFLREMSELSRQGNSEEVYQHINALAFLLFRAADDKQGFESHLKDMYIEKESKKMIEEIEGMLSNE